MNTPRKLAKTVAAKFFRSISDAPDFSLDVLFPVNRKINWVSRLGEECEDCFYPHCSYGRDPADLRAPNRASTAGSTQKTDPKSEGSSKLRYDVP